MRRVEAVKPAVSTTAPAPTAMPAGLTSTSRPLELSVPKMAEGSLPITRLIDRLAALGWSKRVLLPAGIEKLCQLIAERFVPAAFCVVTTRLLPCCTRLACPEITCAPLGWPSACPAPMNAAATARAMPAGRKPATAGL